MSKRDDVKCCRNCVHSNQEGMTKHYKQWCLACDLAEKYANEAYDRFKLAQMPAAVHGPHAMWLDDSDHSGADCPFFERK